MYSTAQLPLQHDVWDVVREKNYACCSGLLVPPQGVHPVCLNSQGNVESVVDSVVIVAVRRRVHMVGIVCDVHHGTCKTCLFC